MQVAITGHSAGIGQALSKIFSAKGHTIVGLSRSNGYNIRSLPKVAAVIEPCDIFINNAQVGYAQTELLYEIHRRWVGLHKHIIVISTQMTQNFTAPNSEWDEYWLQKITLETAAKQLMTKELWPCITIVKPGAIATQPEQSQPDYADVNEWASKLVHCLEIVGPNLRINEIALGVNYNAG